MALHQVQSIEGQKETILTVDETIIPLRISTKIGQSRQAALPKLTQDFGIMSHSVNAT